MASSNRRVVIVNGKLRFYDENILVIEATMAEFLHNIARIMWEERGVLPSTEKLYRSNDEI